MLVLLLHGHPSVVQSKVFRAAQIREPVPTAVVVELNEFAGDRVSAGQIIGEPAPNALGAILHAPFSGTVREVNDKHIILEK